MPQKPSIILDLLASAWVVFVAVMYYGGYFSPLIGIQTGVGSLVYGVVLIVSVLLVAYAFLRPKASGDSGKKD